MNSEEIDFVSPFHALPYFPEIYPDELLYSVIARFTRHTGAAPSAALNSLFGVRGARPSYFLPTRLEALASRIPKGREITARKLSVEHTLLPFYTAFRPRPMLEDAIKIMSGSSSLLSQKLGAYKGVASRGRRLRFCPHCNKEAAERYGELYWMRRHQLETSLVCPKHSHPLLESSVDLNRTKISYVACHPSACPTVPGSTPTLESDVIDKVHSVARVGHAMLESWRIPLLKESETLRHLLIRSGFGSRKGGQVAKTQLSLAVARSYGDALELWPALSPPRPEDKAWQTRLLSHSPLHQAILYSFASSLPCRGVAIGPFGSGPWRCFNPVFNHAEETPVTRLVVRRWKARYVGEFECSCGYVYTRRLDDDGRLHPPRLKTFGPTVVPALKAMLAAGESGKAIAAKLGVSWPSVPVIARQHGVDVPWRPKPKSPTVFGGAKRKGRKAQSPPAPTKTYYVPVAQDRRYSPTDWNAVDNELAASVRREAARIRSLPPPARVTTNALAKAIPRGHLLQTKLDRLPETRAVLADVLEEPHDALRRKMRAVIQSEIQLGRVPTATQLLRLVGRPTAHLEFARAVLTEVLKERG